MKKEKNTSLVDELLERIGPFREPETDDFFYTRLKARMEQPAPAWVFPLRPAWVISAFTLLLVLNGVMLFQQHKTKKETTTAVSPVEQVAESYDLHLSSTNY